MKIVICGSSFFRKDKVKVRDIVSKMGHDAIIDPWTVDLAEGKRPELLEQMGKEHFEAKKQYDFIRWYFDAIRNADAVLVTNYDKKGIEGYIGSNTLMEIAVAYDHRKKIYVLNDVGKDVGCYDEVMAVDAVFLSGDLEGLK